MGCMNIVIFLLQHEANPDLPTVRGETPLHLAARANQTDIIRILLRNGAQVDARARVRIALRISCPMSPAHHSERIFLAISIGWLVLRWNVSLEKPVDSNPDSPVDVFLLVIFSPTIRAIIS